MGKVKSAWTVAAQRTVGLQFRRPIVRCHGDTERSTARSGGEAVLPGIRWAARDGQTTIDPCENKDAGAPRTPASTTAQ